MNLFPIFKLASNSAFFRHSFYNRSIVSFSIKLCANKFTMEVTNGIITKPYQNGISSLKSENVKWKSEKKLESLPRPIAVCGPSGSGKSTLLKRFLAEYKDYVEFSISHTTRKPRPNEIDGKDYHFVSREDMEKAIANGEFLEHAEFSGNIYGTSKNAVKQILKNGKLCILDVEMVGVKNLKKTDLNPKFIFVKTPSIEVLEERLRNRNTESEESLQKRLARAKEELVYGETPGNFNLVLVNDDLEEAYKQLKEFLLPDIEGLKRRMHH